ncbi:MAG TPA: hypothetical protein VJQ54_22265, partial [Candidatus Sulfotelmatobacter sp.]|nr:hypothetical protein [Candidatus Sulfotelmatobacter sp.]
AQSLAVVLFYGTRAFREWLWMILNLRELLPFLEPRTYQTHCLRTFWSMLVPWPPAALALYLLCAAAVLVVTILIWRRNSIPLKVRYSALLFATVLIAPHLTVYDLVILAPAILLLSDELLAIPANAVSVRIATALYCVYLLPLIGPLAQWTHVQLSVIAMTVIVFYIYRRNSLGVCEEPIPM